MLKEMFGPQADAQPQPAGPTSPEAGPPAPVASSSAPASSSSSDPEAPPASVPAPASTSAPAAAAVAEGDDPVSRILRDVGAALSRILTPAPGSEAAAGSAERAPEKELVAVASPVGNAPPVAAAPLPASAPPAPPASPAAAAPPAQAPEPAPSASSGNPIAQVFSEIDALLTRLQLALNVQKYAEPQPAPELAAPAAPVQQGGVVLDGSPLLTMDGRPVLSGSGAPVGTIAKAEPAPAVPAVATADDPVSAAFREVTEFLKRLLGGEAGTKPAP